MHDMLMITEHVASLMRDRNARGELAAPQPRTRWIAGLRFKGVRWY